MGGKTFGSQSDRSKSGRRSDLRHPPQHGRQAGGNPGPPMGTDETREAKAELERLLLRKKVEFETKEWDRLGRSIAFVKVDGRDVNKAMADFLEDLQGP